MKYYYYPRIDAPPSRHCARCKAPLAWPLYWIDVRTGERVCDGCAFQDEEGSEESSTG